MYTHRCACVCLPFVFVRSLTRRGVCVVCVSVCLSFCLSVCLSVYLSICLVPRFISSLAAALERNLEAAMEKLADIEEGYRTYHKIATTVADRHPVAVNDNLRNYRHNLCARFQLYFPKAEEVDGLSAEELAERKAQEAAAAEAAAKKRTRRSVVSTTMQDGEGGGAAEGGAAEGDAAEGGGDGGGGGGGGGGGEEGDGSQEGGEEGGAGAGNRRASTASAAQANPKKLPRMPVVDDWGELPVHSTKAGTEYCQVLKPKDIAKKLLDSDDEDEDESDDEEAAAGVGEGEGGEDVGVQVEGDGAGDEKTGEGGDGPSSDSDGKSGGGEEGKGEGSGDEEGAAAAPVVPEYDERGVPLDPDGVPCTAFLEIRASVLGKVIKALRNRLLNVFDKTAASRRKAMSALRKERVEYLTDELEERLRRHWPRKGHAEVKVKQPREGELISHRQRQERHARNILQRNAGHGRSFAKALEKAYADLEKFTKRQAALARALPSRTNLASLQGVLQKCKRFRADFKEAAADWHTQLQPFAADEPRRLKQANQEFLRSCKLFSQGGECVTLFCLFCLFCLVVLLLWRRGGGVVLCCVVLCAPCFCLACAWRVVVQSLLR